MYLALCTFLGASSGFREEKKADGAKHTGPEGSQISLETSTAKPSGSVAETFKIIEGIINEDVVKSTQGVFLFELSGKEEVLLLNPNMHKLTVKFILCFHGLSKGAVKNDDLCLTSSM